MFFFSIIYSEVFSSLSLRIRAVYLLYAREFFCGGRDDDPQQISASAKCREDHLEGEENKTRWNGVQLACHGRRGSALLGATHTAPSPAGRTPQVHVRANT